VDLSTLPSSGPPYHPKPAKVKQMHEAVEKGKEARRI
jgi:hypothetical protein